MNRPRLQIPALAIVMAALARQLIAANAPPASASQADKDWQAYREANDFEPPKTDKEPTPKENEEWVENYFLKTRELGWRGTCPKDQTPAEAVNPRQVLPGKPSQPVFSPVGDDARNRRPAGCNLPVRERALAA